MGAGPLVLLLVGMMMPAALILLAILFDALTLIWVAYQLWHDEWSVRLWHGVRRFAHSPHWHALHHH